MMVDRIVRLIAKDFLVLRHERTFTFIFFFMPFITAVAAPGYSSWFMILFGLMPAVNYVSYTFAFDQQGAERLYASLPVRRSELVAARYGGMLSIAVCFLLMGYLLNGVAVTALPGKLHRLSAGFALFYLLLFSVVSSAALPAYFRLGPLKARVILLTLYIIPAMALGIILGVSNGTPPVSLGGAVSLPYASPGLGLSLLLLPAAALYSLSMLLSIRFFKRRDL